MSTSTLENLYAEDLYHIPSSLMIVISRPWAEIPEEQKALLAKILSSVRVSMGSVRIVELKAVSAESLQAFAPEKVLVFGAPVEQAIKPYEKTSLDGMNIIWADDLSQLDDVKKKNLWGALKQMFGL